MSELESDRLLFSAISASLLAGKEILRVYEGHFEVEKKEDQSPLTIADQNAHLIISEKLKETSLPVLSEEGKSIDFALRNKWDFFWMVDPLDGTKEFIKRNGEFTVNIALIHQQKSILGVVYVPVTRTLYFASGHRGAYKIILQNEEEIVPEELIAAATKLPVENSSRKFTVVASRSHLSEETEMFIAGLRNNHPELEFISSGSSIKLCLVAEGSADVYPRFAPTMEWDTAAGQAICEIAGMKVTDYKTNKPLLYNKQELLNNWFIVSS
ncbi:MAG: 3'(2'),5'-bisphosphate nucleotidase CysQ [Bacteroidota bacterium]|nr:3'(2'),5'-bisphosphate nucleotidase CysQ [Bacteroidota bacterium]